ncbi:unnamed protein product [Blumeria hordei]|uniref:tRNA dimethylallyltransferase n=2 Tax=Blumeria hordei TaxID=2867405 RepID=A0A383UWE5_BLUHO|nr:unnamed protein product [Blumeria hordei]
MFRRLFKMSMARKSPRRPLIVIIGATGTGKSQLAIDLAKKFNGEIINADAMQMYVGLPIITNKVSQEEQEEIPHHLLGHVKLEEETWRVDAFQSEARKLLHQIRSKDKIPIVVGGTHYYAQSLLFEDSILSARGAYGTAENLSSDRDISKEFPILDGPSDVILKKLKEVDPVMAERWHPNDIRKIRRSLEIFLTTGEKASDAYAKQKNVTNILLEKESDTNRLSEHLDATSTLIFWLHADSKILDQRLDARVNKMMKAGLLEEIRCMHQYWQEQQQIGVRIDKTRGIWASIGWKQFDPYLSALDKGEDMEQILELCIQQTQAATRRYAKRQVRWIQLKLRPALTKCKSLRDRLYLLDSSDTSRFQQNVSELSISITSKMLANEDLPSPLDSSAIARDVLGGVKEKPDVWFRGECEICQVKTMNEIEWQLHLKSRRHRTMNKRKVKEGKSNELLGG